MAERTNIYRNCWTCERPFKVIPSHVNKPRRQGRFCTQQCHRFARAVFRQMLEDGTLQPFLKAALAEQKKAEAEGRVTPLQRDIELWNAAQSEKMVRGMCDQAAKEVYGDNVDPEVIREASWRSYNEWSQRER